MNKRERRDLIIGLVDMVLIALMAVPVYILLGLLLRWWGLA